MCILAHEMCHYFVWYFSCPSCPDQVGHGRAWQWLAKYVRKALKVHWGIECDLLQWATLRQDIRRGLDSTHICLHDLLGCFRLDDCPYHLSTSRKVSFQGKSMEISRQALFQPRIPRNMYPRSLLTVF